MLSPDAGPSPDGPHTHGIADSSMGTSLIINTHSPRITIGL